MIATPTKPPATSGIGWSNGMAAQVSLPNMVLLRLLGPLLWILGPLLRLFAPLLRLLGSLLRPRGYVQIWPAGLRAGSWWQYLRGDLLEQLGGGRTVGERTYVHALRGQRGVARGIKSWAGGARGLDPGGELFRRHRMGVEMHGWEAVTAKVGRKAVECARGVRLQVQLRRHAVHGVDHAAELRDEEGVHHARRGQVEVNGYPGRQHKLVHARDTLVRVNEKPLPIQRDDLDVERWRFRCQRLRGVEGMRIDPAHATK